MGQEKGVVEDSITPFLLLFQHVDVKLFPLHSLDRIDARRIAPVALVIKSITEQETITHFNP